MHISSSNGFKSLIDDCDAHIASGFSWHCQSGANTRYFRGHKSGSPKDRAYLHRLIVGAKEGEIVDHINGDGLDNRRENLRVVPQGVNNVNRSTTKGCHFEKYTGKWRAEIWKDGKRFRSKRFETQEEAREKYLEMRSELYPGVVFVRN